MKEVLLLKHPILFFPKASPSPMRGPGGDQRAGGGLDLSPDGINLDSVLAEIEKEYLVKALEMAGGSKSKATEILRNKYAFLEVSPGKTGNSFRGCVILNGTVSAFSQFHYLHTLVLSEQLFQSFPSRPKCYPDQK